MNENPSGARIARYLDDSVADLEPRVVRRLEAARERALDRVRERAAATTVGTSGGAARLAGPSHPFLQRLALPMAALVIGVLGMYLWQQHHAAPAESDEIELLADELPVHAYLDKGFQQWLTPSLQR